MESFNNWTDAGFSKIESTKKYDWKEMCDGSIWTARHGSDFTCTTTSFRAILTSYAERHNLKVEIHAKREIVRFRFSKSEAF